MIRAAEGETEITILTDSAQVKFRLGNIEVTSKLIPGSFPDYRQLIPEKADLEVELDRDELTRVVRLANIFARTSGGAIRIIADQAKNSFTVESVASEMGENSTKVATAGKITTDLSVTLSARFLLDALGALKKDEIALEGQLADGERPRPVVLRNAPGDPDYVHLIMPILR